MLKFWLKKCHYTWVFTVYGGDGGKSKCRGLKLCHDHKTKTGSLAIKNRTLVASFVLPWTAKKNWDQCALLRPLQFITLLCLLRKVDSDSGTEHWTLTWERCCTEIYSDSSFVGTEVGWGLFCLPLGHLLWDFVFGLSLTSQSRQTGSALASVEPWLTGKTR